MKIKINLNRTPNRYDYQNKLRGAIYKWIGRTDLHNKMSPFSFSHIWKKQDKSFLKFASLDDDICMKLIRGIEQDDSLFDDLYVESIDLEQVEAFNSFRSLSPFFVRYNNKHLIFKEAEDAVKYSITKQLGEADFDLKFVNFRGTKLIKVHDYKCKCFVSGVHIEGKDELLKKIQLIGVGHLTGCGFGFVD